MFKRWCNLPKRHALVLGPRRAGKTTFLRTEFPDYEYATLDDFDYLRLARDDPKGFVERLGSKAVIDEIQRVPELTIAVKKIIDETSSHIILTGSSSIGLLDSSADSLAGRIDVINFPTACWGESDGEPTHSFFDDKVDLVTLAKAKREFDKALRLGGFPEVVTQSTVEGKKAILKNYKNTYFTRDLAQLSNIENIEGLMAILLHVTKSLGSHLETSSFAKESGLSFPTAKKYLNILIQSQLGFKLYGYQYGIAKRYIKAAKMYYADNGILTSLNAEVSSGQLFESFVISELEKRRKLGFIQSDQFFYYRTVGGAEVDLVFETATDVYVIEIKSKTSLTRKDIRNVREFKGNHTKKRVKAFVIYQGMDYREIDSVSCIPVFALYKAR